MVIRFVNILRCIRYSGVIFFGEGAIRCNPSRSLITISNIERETFFGLMLAVRLLLWFVGSRDRVGLIRLILILRQ
jgi:hypothetical protein